MLSKKLIALFVTVATVSATFAGYWENGKYYHGTRPGHFVEDVGTGTGHAVEKVGEGTGDFIGNVFTGGRHSEHKEQRKREEQQRMEHEERE